MNWLTSGSIFLQVYTRNRIQKVQNHHQMHQQHNHKSRGEPQTKVLLFLPSIQSISQVVAARERPQDGTLRKSLLGELGYGLKDMIS